MSFNNKICILYMIYEFGRHIIYREYNIVCHYCKSHTTFDVRDWTYGNLIGLLDTGIPLAQQLKCFCFRYHVLCHFNCSIRSKYIL